MDRKHFQFLYQEIKDCFGLYGNLRNPDTEDTLRILYLRGIEGLPISLEANSIFLCAKQLDVVVLGVNNDKTIAAWDYLSLHVRTKILALSEDRIFARMPSADKVIRLSPQHNSYCEKFGGWEFYLHYSPSGSVVMSFGAKDRYGNRLIKECVTFLKPADENCLCRRPLEADGLGCIPHTELDLSKFQAEKERVDKLMEERFQAEKKKELPEFRWR
jgi:hypothetical protein